MTTQTGTRALRLSLATLLLAALGLLPASAAPAADAPTGEKPPPAECSLLDDAKTRGKMDGLLLYLLKACGREEELGQVTSAAFREGEADGGPGFPDVQVNDSSGDSGVSTTQSETSISRNEVTGTLCSGYNDSNDSSSFGGFSRSTDGGATWDDRGSVPAPSSGDPSIVWRRADGKFYYALLRSGGLGLWRSDDDCLTFTFVSQIASGGDDKELMAIDNNAASPFFGRLYVAWTDFSAGARIYETHSTDAGATWSAQVALSGAGFDVQGAWPVVAPNNDVYVGWLRWNPFPSGPIDVEIARSTDGGATWGLVTNPITGEVNPRDSAATGSCGRPALNENIRYLPSPQVAVGPDGALHVIYSYDPDGFNVGDVVDVFYRRSTDSGATWGSEIRLNDDATLNDQYYPTLSVGSENILVATWYDRRLDGPNELQDTFKSISPDGGLTWLPNERVSDVSSPIYLDPSLATCYHGDYDQNTQEPGFGLLQWSDDRNFLPPPDSRNDPDVWFEREPVSSDFVLIPDPSSLSICAPADAVYGIEVLQFQGFSEEVTFSASGAPVGTTVGFSPPSLTPPGTSTMTVSNTGAGAPGVYDITVTGTSSPSAIEHDTTVSLALFNASPAAPSLTSPANGSTDQPTRPTFVWGAVAQAATYTIEIATDSGFTNIVDGAAGLTDTSYQPETDLDTNSEHFWRVRATNACGTGTDSAVWSFITLRAPGDCTFGVAPIEVFFDDLESGAPGWSHSGTVDTWTLSGARVHSGSFAWYAENVNEVSDQYLDSPAIVLPTGEAPLTLQFWNWQEIEGNPPGCFDGAVLEISTDGGSSWVRLEPELLTDPYDGVVNNCCGNPIQDENAWCGDPQDWLESIVDLDAFAGETVQLRFRLATDSTVDREGWYVDDVTIQSCPTEAVIFSDGFESGDTSAWSFQVP